MARLAPAEVDPGAVAQAAAAIEAATRVHDLMHRIHDDVDDEDWTPAPADLDDLHDGLETVWRAWRQRLGRPRP